MRPATLVLAVAGMALLSGCGTSADTSSSSGPPLTAAGSATTTSAATPAASPSPAACAYLSGAEILQYTGITISGTSDLGGGGCAYLSTSGTHSAPKALQFLDGHDGVIAGVAAGAISPTPQCTSVTVPGLTGPAAVCVIPGPELITAFPVAAGKVGEINVFSSTPVSTDQAVHLITLAYPRMGH